ncbi:MAG: hypothetical protein JOZ75_04215 [Candidatus Dormibacteraeota bacterium]|nr:hypothetical protein [Candidatus Dormibacteraeota bacterium]
MARRARVPVGVEAGAKRVFAFAVDWPGWCRTAKTEALALEALAAYGPRYAPVAAEAGVAFPKQFDLAVAARVPGTATTDFGAPDARLPGDTRPLPTAEAAHLIALMRAGWAVLDDVASRAPEALLKGPRGGGRDRDRMLDHVLGAEQAYARKLGVRLTQPATGDTAAIRTFRDVIAAALQARAADPATDSVSPWPVRYFIRRLTWHALDHAWEMEDRSPA